MPKGRPTKHGYTCSDCGRAIKKTRPTSKRTFRCARCIRLLRDQLNGNGFWS